MRFAVVALLSAILQQLCCGQSSGEVRLDYSAGGPVLGGFLEIPEGDGPHPAVLLVSPAGDHPRDGIASRSHHLGDLAVRLARQGIASLRVDNAGIGKSRDERHAAYDWSRTSADLAGDLRRHVRFLRTQPKIDPALVGILAHGDGCVPAAVAASEDRGLGFAVEH